METFHINKSITPEEVIDIVRFGKKIALHPDAIARMEVCRTYLENKLKNNHQAIYGINTGFGALCNTVVAADELEDLQRNIVLSHACGTGREVPADVVRSMLVLKIQNMAIGHSGVKRNTVDLLVELYNRDILPIVYEMGSLGASGDLAPLAHLSLPLIGEGEVIHQGARKTAQEALQAEGLRPVILGAKEGLALLNGTQFMGGYGNQCSVKGLELWAKAIAVAALSLEAYNGRKDAFLAPIHRIRPHEGQIKTAAKMLDWIKDSQIIETGADKDVQDPYSFRCVPQVMGSSYDAILFAHKNFTIENASVSDNPLIFPEEDLIVSGGNFHGQPLALSLDMLALALSEIGSISERRMYRLLAGKRGLPPFLAENAGLHSGYMILQYATAAIASKNKQLCTPATADSIESSNGQEDHVSMGANAAVKCMEVLDNVERMLAFELMTAARALEFRNKEAQSKPLAKLLADFRQALPHNPNDTYLHVDMEKALAFFKTMNVNSYLA
jgi:histidine ammonia-lyase